MYERSAYLPEIVVVLFIKIPPKEWFRIALLGDLYYTVSMLSVNLIA